MDLQGIYDALTTYLNPQTPPLALRMVPAGEALPEKAKIPSQHFKNRITICQCFSMVRYSGITIALGKDDQSCAAGSIILGFREPIAYFNEGNLVAGMYAADHEVGAVMEKELERFPVGKYSHLLVAPLSRANFEPDLINIYGNPAQMARLVQAARYNTGIAVKSSFTGRAECAHAIVRTMESGECQLLLLCNGERVFAHAQDFEMSFALPMAKADELVSGLAGSHKNGIRYPVPFWVNYKAAFPPSIAKIDEIWND